MSSVLWWVTNGRAWAPPASTCRIGVSTSTKPRLVQRLAEAGERRVADVEDPAGVGVDDEVGVALAEAGVGIGQAVPLVGQRADRLGQQFETLDLDRDLADTRGHHGAVHADPVATVERLHVGERRFADGRLRHEQLDLARRGR